MHLKKRIKWLLPAAAAAGLAAFFLAGLDGGLTVRSYTVESGKVTAPVRLAVLTDLHACDYGEDQRELLDAVAAQAPDLVLLVGDIVDDEPRMPETRALETVEALAEGWPVYYVTGNHEFWSPAARRSRRRSAPPGPWCWRARPSPSRRRASRCSSPAWMTRRRGRKSGGRRWRRRPPARTGRPSPSC